MPEYRLSLDFTAADDAQAERLAEAWAGTCAAEYGTRYAGLGRVWIPPEQVRAAIRLLWPDEITPQAKRVLDQLCDQADTRGDSEPIDDHKETT